MNTKITPRENHLHNQSPREQIKESEETESTKRDEEDSKNRLSVDSNKEPIGKKDTEKQETKRTISDNGTIELNETKETEKQEENIKETIQEKSKEDKSSTSSDKSEKDSLQIPAFEATTNKENDPNKKKTSDATTPRGTKTGIIPISPRGTKPIGSYGSTASPRGPRPTIIKLQLPTIIQGPNSPTRSNPPDTSTKDIIPITFRKSARSELKEIAKKIGEAYISADLNTLLQFKYEADIIKNSKKYKQYHRVQNFKKTELSIAEEKLQGTMKKKSENPGDKIKFIIPSILGTLSQEREYYQFARNPTNILFQEILYNQYHPELDDEKLRNTIYGIFFNLAEQVELNYRLRWGRITENAK